MVPASDPLCRLVEERNPVEAAGDDAIQGPGGGDEFARLRAATRAATSLSTAGSTIPGRFRLPGVAAAATPQ